MGPSRACQRLSGILTQCLQVILTLFKACNQQPNRWQSLSKEPVQEVSRMFEAMVSSPKCVLCNGSVFLHERLSSKGPTPHFEEQGPSLASPKVRRDFSHSSVIRGATYPLPEGGQDQSLQFSPLLRAASCTGAGQPGKHRASSKGS